MIKSMTGFASKEAEITPLGKVIVELKSANHKFLEIVFHLPEGFLSLEERIRKEIETKIKRGRLVCAINIISKPGVEVYINQGLLKKYFLALKKIKQQFRLPNEISLDALIHLPGVLSLAEEKKSGVFIWPALRILIRQALDDLIKARQKEGRALYTYLKRRTDLLRANLEIIKAKFKKVIENKLVDFKTDEERLSFLKDTDISEELERIEFHLKNFKNKLAKNGPLGKELDFIAQEMQREANTLGAKSCAAVISARAVQIKSQLEKLREQLQNIE